MQSGSDRSADHIRNCRNGGIAGRQGCIYEVGTFDILLAPPDNFAVVPCILVSQRGRLAAKEMLAWRCKIKKAACDKSTKANLVVTPGKQATKQAYLQGQAGYMRYKGLVKASDMGCETPWLAPTPGAVCSRNNIDAWIHNAYLAVVHWKCRCSTVSAHSGSEERAGCSWQNECKGAGK